MQQRSATRKPPRQLRRQLDNSSRKPYAGRRPDDPCKRLQFRRAVGRTMRLMAYSAIRTRCIARRSHRLKCRFTFARRRAIRAWRNSEPPWMRTGADRKGISQRCPTTRKIGSSPRALEICDANQRARRGKNTTNGVRAGGRRLLSSGRSNPDSHSSASAGGKEAVPCRATLERRARRTRDMMRS